MTSEMISLSKFYGKDVVVKFINEDGVIKVATGILTDFDEGSEDNEGLVAIQSDTDYDRIPLNQIRKIFLKE